MKDLTGTLASMKPKAAGSAASPRSCAMISSMSRLACSRGTTGLIFTPARLKQRADASGQEFNLTLTHDGLERLLEVRGRAWMVWSSHENTN